MRHFVIAELGLPLAIARLPSRMQLPSSPVALIDCAGAEQRIASLLRLAARAEALPAITSLAEPKLNAAPAAAEKPVRIRRQEAPSRRFLDLELEPW